MKCIYCGHLESKVIDSRSADEGAAIRRRRECLNCGKRFTSFEKIENVPIMVIKKDMSRQVFNREKLLNGLLRACEKRPVSTEQLEQVIDEIEISLYNNEREVSSNELGEMVLEKLRNIDEVAYIRFASVYREFNDVNSFVEALNALKEK